MPPAPIGDRISYGPRRDPSARSIKCLCGFYGPEASVEDRETGNAAVPLFEFAHGNGVDSVPFPTDRFRRLRIPAGYDHGVGKSENVGRCLFLRRHRNHLPAVFPRESHERIDREKRSVSQVRAAGEQMEQIPGQRDGGDVPLRLQHHLQLVDRLLVRAFRKAHEDPSFRDQDVSPIQGGRGLEPGDGKVMPKRLDNWSLLAFARGDRGASHDRSSSKNAGAVLHEYRVGTRVVGRELENLETGLPQRADVIRVLLPSQLEIDRRRGGLTRQRRRIRLSWRSNDGTHDGIVRPSETESFGRAGWATRP